MRQRKSDIFLTGSLLGAALLAGCSARGVEDVPPQPEARPGTSQQSGRGVLTGADADLSITGTATPAQITALTGREWQVETMRDYTVPDMLAVTLNFSETGRLHGTSGCNRFVTAYQYDGLHFAIGRITSSRKACAGAATETEEVFFRSLAAVTQLGVTDDKTLMLSGPDGEVMRAR